MGKKPDEVQFSQLVDMFSPQAVLEEVKNIFINSYPVGEFGEVRKVFADFLRLYSGKYPGFHACNTHYHDKMHVTDALLAMARLIDGHNIAHKKMPVRLAKLGLIAAIFHDAGFIKSVQDVSGTGAKYTLTHVDRSIHFLKAYFRKNGFPSKDARSAVNMILCTDMALPVEKIRFSGPEEKKAGFMLGTSDLLGQMASRCYLERLLFLYREFNEGQVKGYSSELELLRKTVDFARFIDKRLAVTLGDAAGNAKVHFRKRYRINRDLYREAMGKQLAYLKDTVLNHPEKYRAYLRRSR
ncbi:MAG: hypothetical protein PHV36_03135 [Elusimicrobiales bacterium]|nr:hypothetical protein [Elusimicrobiales bacterium]